MAPSFALLVMCMAHLCPPSPLTEGKHSAPGVYLLHPHREELNGKGDSVSLTCLVQGFFPEDISLQWMKNHEDEKETEYITTPPIKDGADDSNFFLYSKLKVSKDSWNRGDTYTCMVIHEALKMKEIIIWIKLTPIPPTESRPLLGWVQHRQKRRRRTEIPRGGETCPKLPSMSMPELETESRCPACPTQCA
uniref:Ig-like domain-containing protein n=1 Tax=Chelonoidis abingdonii TaxID=106734 RepID=A0A8C0G931_CHEAB